MATRLQNIKPSQPNSVAATVKIIYSDVNLYFGINAQDIILYGDDALNNMIDNILFTVPGERHYEPTFGSMLPYLLYEPGDSITAWKMETASIDALGIWMPYLKMILSQSNITYYADQQFYSIKIGWVDTISRQPGVYYQQVARGGGS
jgi:phage baseplate assembly protein W